MICHNPPFREKGTVPSVWLHYSETRLFVLMRRRNSTPPRVETASEPGKSGILPGAVDGARVRKLPVVGTCLIGLKPASRPSQ